MTRCSRIIITICPYLLGRISIQILSRSLRRRRCLPLVSLAGAICVIAEKNSPQNGFTGQNFIRQAFLATAKNLTFSKLMPVSRLLFGGQRVGFIMKIRGAGFNGTAVTLWVGACQMKISAKSNAGGLLHGIFPSSKRIAGGVITPAGLFSAKPYFIGPMTAERYDF